MAMRLKLPNGTSWPDPAYLGEVQHRLRYGGHTAGDILSAAEAISTLLHLYEVPGAEKHLPMIRAARREAARAKPREQRQGGG